MYRYVIAAVIGTVALAAPARAADPQYMTIKMEIDVAKPAAAVWAKVGGYCDITKWLDVTDCAIRSGDGGIGTVRLLRGGQVTEILVSKTDLSYGYTQPVRAGQFYNLYHGFLEAKPVTAQSSKLLYTLMYDISDKADEAARKADVAQRRMRFEGALQNMKKLAEAP
ncbi:MAG TPA: SRPBCC family protein [Vicinamibacterales bacterium]|nr:SRPBCC family protein [Vicinamibacterales bacterium]